LEVFFLVFAQKIPQEVVKKRCDALRVLMFGWEFPPYFAGGVGMVCYELAKQLVAQGTIVDYIMPFAPDSLNPDFLNLVDASRQATDADLATSGIKMTRVRSLLAAYQTPEEYEQTLKELSSCKSPLAGAKRRDPTAKLYGENLLEEIDMFAHRIAVMIQKGHFTDADIIHAHDWTTVPAAVVAKRLLNIPLIVHIHITEVNKNNGQGVNPEVYTVEREGMMAADKIVAVSNCIKQTLIEHYGVPAEKIDVIHNGGVTMDPVLFDGKEFKGDNKVVSYLGRITGMKGPLNFVEAARIVLEHAPKTKFIMAGTGDQLQACIDKVRRDGIEDKFYFHGFYTREDANMFFDMSDVFVLPSIMEPFGVTPLEAMCKETPTIVTKQSGVAEVVNHCYKVDFWDINKMASQIITLLTYPVLHATMKKHGFIEAKSLTWEKPAQDCIALYTRMIS